MKANVGNVADKDQIKKAKKLVENQRRLELRDIKMVMSLPSGSRVLWRILHEFCHIDQLSSDPRSGSMTYFHEGARSVGLSLKSEIMEAAFKEYQVREAEWAAENEIDKLDNKQVEGENDAD